MFEDDACRVTPDIELHERFARARRRAGAAARGGRAIGLHEPGAADIDVNELHQGFLRGLRARGGALQRGRGDRSRSRAMATDGRCRSATAAGFRAPLLLNAAGAWVDQVAALAGVAPLGIMPKRRSAFVFDPPPGLATRGLAVHQRPRRDLLFQAGRRPAARLVRRTPTRPIRTTCSRRNTTSRWASTSIEQATTLTIRRPTPQLGRPALVRRRRRPGRRLRHRCARVLLGGRAGRLRHPDLGRDGRGLRQPGAGPAVAVPAAGCGRDGGAAGPAFLRCPARRRARSAARPGALQQAGYNAEPAAPFGAVIPQGPPCS